MLQDQSTLHQVRFHLHRELRKSYPEEETASLARLILEHTGFPSTRLLMEPQLVPSPATIVQINEIVAEIHTGKPLQYILGYTHFCDLKICVNQNVLIPRPETEEMVFRIIEQISKLPRRILDVGTGSGCIALAMKHRFPEAEVCGIDESRAALELAAANGKMNGLEVTWNEENILDRTSWRNPEGFDLIISNPPYVLKSEQSGMHSNVLNFEPGSALFVEDHDPLIFYRAIAEYGRNYLNKHGTLVVEINERFGPGTARIFEVSGFQNVTILKDLHEKERYIEVTR
jgi:release factor glutamine methyltransferase